MTAASHPTSAEPDVSVIVVTYNNRDLVGRCLVAIFDGAQANSAEVIVVDNGSSDSTVKAVKALHRPVRLIALSENVGFAKAVGRAWNVAKGSYVALVNSDAFLDRGCIDTLVDALRRRREVGIVGAKLRYPDGRSQPSAGTFPSLVSGLWVALFLHRLPGASRLGVGYLADDRLYRRPRRVDWVSAAVCAARAEVGPPPCSSFMYGEDVEWARGANAAGLQVWTEPAATAVHVGRASVDQSQEHGFAQRRRAQFELAWFARRGGLAVLASRLVLIVHALARMSIYGAGALMRRSKDARVGEYAALLRAALSTNTRVS